MLRSFGLGLLLLVGGLAVQTPRAGAQSYQEASLGFAPPELEPRPPRGIAGIVVGTALLLGATESMALLHTCGTDSWLDPWKTREPCVRFSVTLATISVAAGVPALVIGLIHRQRYKAWRAARAHRHASIEPMRLPGGAGVSWALRF
ncbi:MAG: hypothetical protein QM778_19120 [Myxococcales bacterium]